MIQQQKTMLVVSPAGGSPDSLLDAAVESGAIAGWHDGAKASLRRVSDGQEVPSCPLADLSLSGNDEDILRAERFWNGAIEEDGSMSPLLLSVMRMDDSKRATYRRRYKTKERYVQEMSSVHADAVLMPDGSFVSNDGMRGRNQLHEWNVSFADRFLLPLVRQDGTDDGPCGDGITDGTGFVVSAYTYDPK